jgi:hypothetical protein
MPNTFVCTTTRSLIVAYHTLLDFEFEFEPKPHNPSSFPTLSQIISIEYKKQSNKFIVSMSSPGLHRLCITFRNLVNVIEKLE